MSDAANERELLRDMAEMFEEFKPFPKDKVNKQIDKAKSDRDNVMDNKDGDREKHDSRSHKMTAVKNYRTKVTDRQKSQQKHTGSDHDKTIDQGDKHLADVEFSRFWDVDFFRYKIAEQQVLFGTDPYEYFVATTISQ